MPNDSTSTTFTPEAISATSTFVCSKESSPGVVPDNDNYPGIPLLIAKSGASLHLTWSAPGGTCLTSDYEIYRGSLRWFGYNHSIYTCTTSGSTAAIISSDSSSYYYLVVAQFSGNEGSYGLDFYNLQRPPASISCLAQQIGTCD